MKNQAGFGIIEVIVAMAIFVIIAVTGVTTVIGSFSTNRLGDEETKATAYAQVGLEAVRSIKNQGWEMPLLATDCSGSCGIDVSGNSWGWLGASNTLSKFTRTITVTSVQRDVSGNIVVSGGTDDPDTKKIKSTVTWNFSPTRSNTVELSTYLTNFRKAISWSGGLLIYGDGTIPPKSKYRLYNDSSNMFGAETPSVSSSAGQVFVLRASPTTNEAVAGFVTSTGVLNILCFDGSNWTQEWTATVGGTESTRGFDIAYETNSGDVMVLYSTNTSTTNELAYRTKNGDKSCGGANWAGAANMDPVRTSGVVYWVKMAWDRRSSQNLITAIWADANSDLSAKLWSGSAWTNEPSAASETSLEVVASAQDAQNVEDFDVEFESLSGDVMLVWANSAGSNGTNGVRYRTCTGGTSACTWGAVTTPPSFADDATNLDISANPNTDAIVFASIGNAGSDLQVGYWSGSAWTNTANRDTSAGRPLAGTKLVAVGWLISGAATRSIVVYNDASATNIGYYTGNLGVFTAQTDFAPTPSFANPQKWYGIEMNPLSKDQLMLSLSDNNNDLFSKRLVMTAAPAFTWTNSDGGALETSLPQAISSPFSYAFRRH